MEYSEFYYVDNLLRAALHGTKKEILRAVRLLNNADEASGNEIKLNANAEYFVRHMLIHRGAADSLAAFGELYGDTRKEQFFLLSYEEANRYSFQLMSVCLFSDEDVLRQMLGDGCLLRGFLYYSCMDNPLYILMLCGKYGIMAEQLKKLKAYTDEISLGDMATLRQVFMSAAAFRDGRALKILFENLSGTAFLDFIPELAIFPDSISYLAENFYMYLGFENRNTPPTLGEFFDAEHMCGKKLHLMHNAYRSEDKVLFDYYLENLSPVSVLTAFDCSYFKLTAAGNNKELLRQILSDEVTVLCGRGAESIPVTECRKFLKGHKHVFDLSAAHTVDLRDNTAEELRYLLAHGVNFPVSDGLCPFTEQLLDRGSRRIVSLMISKGIINKGNYADAAVFLAEHKRLEGLDELNNTKHPLITGISRRKNP